MKAHSLLSLTLSFPVALLLCSCNPGNSPAPVSALMGQESRIDAIMDGMTLEQKVAMLHGKHMFSSEGVPSEGIADIQYADGPFGIREEMEPHSWNSVHLQTDSATFFPTGSALAATWSEELSHEYGRAMGIEARLRGKDMILGPAINIQRVPTGGRTYEYLSEDPLLSGTLARGYTLGVQEQGVAVCLKHYALNNQEDYRGFVDVRASPRAMREIYLTPFEMAVREADAWGVMAAYNKVDGRWCSENKVLLTDILRDEWGFKGIVISDWGGTHSVEAVEAGLNVEMPGQSYLGEKLLAAVKDGTVSEEAVNQRVRELLRVRLHVQPVPEDEANKEMTSQPLQQRIAYDVAAHSIVLMKNEDNTLPLDLSSKPKIAVIGDNAICEQSQGGVGAGVKALYEVTPLEGLKEAVGDMAEISYAGGYARYTRHDRNRGVNPVMEADPTLHEEAMECAGDADIILFFAGDNREIETEGSDRKSITLPCGQDAILSSLATLGKPIVTILVTGAPLDLTTVDTLSSSVVVSWFNGSEGGRALADVLVGKISPSGKLPFTFPKKLLTDSPAYALGVFPQTLKDEEESSDIFVDLVNKDQRKGERGLRAPYSEGIFVGYRYFDKNNVDVEYPFGHGLSYSSFEYSDMKVSKRRSGDLRVTLCVRNTGKMAAEEVVQVYASRPGSKIERPERELKGFCRVSLSPSEKKRVTIDIPRERFRHFDVGSSSWVVEEGKVVLLCASSSRDMRLSCESTL